MKKKRKKREKVTTKDSYILYITPFSIQLIPTLLQIAGHQYLKYSPYTPLDLPLSPNTLLKLPPDTLLNPHRDPPRKQRDKVCHFTSHTVTGGYLDRSPYPRHRTNHINPNIVTGGHLDTSTRPQHTNTVTGGYLNRSPDPRHRAYHINPNLVTGCHLDTSTRP